MRPYRHESTGATAYGRDAWAINNNFGLCIELSQISAQLPKLSYMTNSSFTLDKLGANHGIRQIESLPKSSNTIVEIFEFRAAHLGKVDVNKHWAKICPSVVAAAGIIHAFLVLHQAHSQH
jgi:hypothetical protein